MAWKRELTVEKWQRLMEANRELQRNMGIIEFLRTHDAMGHDIKTVYYELQMADAWRDAGMQVYEFDRDFSDSILGEKWVDLLPDCIEFRPHDCFYMKLPCHSLNEGVVVNVVSSENIDGFRPDWFPGCEEKGVHFGGRNGEERAVVNTGSEILCLCSYAISKTLDLMLDDTPIEVYPPSLVVNGVAYICSVNSDIAQVYEPNPKLRKNNAKKRSAATWHEVGYRIGAELRRYERYRTERSPHKGGTVRPHMRRGHWHHYWTGPRNGERRLVLKWIAPTLVGSKGQGIESATVHMVGKGA